MYVGDLGASGRFDPEPFLRPILEDARQNGLDGSHHDDRRGRRREPVPDAVHGPPQAASTEARYPGVPFGPIPTYGGYTTSILLREQGIPTYGFQPIAMNITDTARRHGNDERIFLRDYVNGVTLLSDVVEEYARFPPAPASSVRPAAEATDVIGPRAV